MSVWAGYLNMAGIPNTVGLEGLTTMASSEATYHIGAFFGVAVLQSGGETATLEVATDGTVRAAIGSDQTAGCSATVEPDTRTLTLACDPFGFHGVYTTEHDGLLWFVSDPRLLRRLPGAATGLDAKAIHGYLCFSYAATPATAFPHVAALNAGDRLVLGSHCEQRFNTARWCETDLLSLTESDAVDELRKLLRRAVEERLPPERDVGVFLSGGLDSSLIAALLAEAGANVHLFTLDFGPPFDEELAYARLVAAHLGRPLRLVSARPVDVRRALRPTAAALAQPFGDGVTVPLYLLGQAAAEEVGVVFNGEGGDQLFGGWANKPMIAAEVYRGPGYDREAAYLRTYHRFHGLEEELYTPQARAEVSGLDVGASVRWALNAVGFTTLLHRLRAANLWLKGAQNIAPRATQLAAAHGLRMRAPFFDRALVEWTFGLPPEWLLQGACEKYLLKRAAEPYLPPEVVWRDKRGMGVPTAEWCLGPLRNDVGYWLDSRSMKRDGWFRPELFSALRRGEDQPGEYRTRRLGEKLWALLMLEVWRSAQHPAAHWPTPVGAQEGSLR